MFDPEIEIDKRLAAEWGKVDLNKFYPKIDCDEQELKYSISGESNAPYDRIRNTIDDKPSRMVDSRAWTRNGYALITLNLDTKDLKLAEAGFSMRVRFALTRTGKENQINNMDMCIKTKLPTGTNIMPFNMTRGEWEISLPNLRPDLTRMIDTHEKSERPLPDFFKKSGLTDEDLFIKTIGCTFRNVYPSYDMFTEGGNDVVAMFQHTEDIKNLFLTPHADCITGEDKEAEAEFMGIVGLSKEDMRLDEFTPIMRKRMELLDRVIVSADPFSIKPNTLTKSVRASRALESCYGFPASERSMRADFDIARRIVEASRFALAQQIRPENVDLDNIWHHVGHWNAKLAREAAPEADPFKIMKFHR